MWVKCTCYKVRHMFKRTTCNLKNLMALFICVLLHIFVNFKFFYRYSYRKTFDKQKDYRFFFWGIKTIWMLNLALQICVKNFSFTKHRIDLNLSTIKNFPLLLFLFIAVNNPITCLLGAADQLISKMPGYTLLSKRTNKQAQKEIQKNI